MTELPKSADVVIVGAGIAGASLAAQLPAGRSVVVLEMEERPGFHSTGRSAANWEPSYGPPIARALTRASGAFLQRPPEDFAGARLLTPRGLLMVAATTTDRALVEAALRDGFGEIDRSLAKASFPLLKLRAGDRYFTEQATQDLDVDLLHGGFLRQAKQRGAELVVRCEVAGGRQDDGTWLLRTSKGEIAAPIVVNAAGAWADVVAARLGVPPIGLTPKRRSMAVVPAPAGHEVMGWPQFYPADEAFYCKPAGGRLMISPADADPVEPHDAFADDLRVAEAIAAFEELVDYQVTRVERSWGGLRTFAPDGEFVVGFDPVAGGLFWLAGQGGYGIQTSPATGRLAAALVDGTPIAADLAAEGVRTEALSPARFR